MDNCEIEYTCINNDELVRKIRLGKSLHVSRMWIPEGYVITQPHDDWDYLYLRGVKIRTPRIERNVNIIDLFSGAGGLSFGVKEGLRALGIDSDFTHAVDTDHLALSIHQYNMHTHNCLSENVNSLVDYSFVQDTLNEFRYPPKVIHSLSAANGNTDVVVAGPPCQGFSNLNNYTRRNDDRNLLYLTVPAIAIALGAKIVIIENVREIRSDPRNIIESARALFEKNGYKVCEYMANGPRLGLAQTRNRHFQIAVLTEQKNIDTFIKNVYTQMSVDCERTVDWAIKDLMGMEGKTLFDTPAELSEENRMRIEGMYELDMQEIPQSLRPKSHREMKKLTYRSVYGKLWPDRPAGTITTGFYTPGRGRYIHPHSKRTLTAHEAARLQGFPDSFEFIHSDGTVPNRSTYSKTIGDAVPPIFGFTAILAAISAIS